MRSIYRVLVLSALFAVAANPASAASQPEKNGSSFKPSASAGAPGILKNDPISMAPKNSVAELRPFRRYDGDGPPPSRHGRSTTKSYSEPPGHRRPR